MGVFELRVKIRRLWYILIAAVFAITFLYNTSIAVAEGLSTITGINFTNTSSFNSSYNNSFIHNVEDPEYFVFTYRHDI